MKFPHKTLEWMIRVVERHQDHVLLNKLKQTQLIDDCYKKNRWFGYYQRVGGEKGYWTLENVIEAVRSEKGGEKMFFKNIKNFFVKILEIWACSLERVKLDIP